MKARLVFLFDVDGTLTPSRGQIDPNFKIWFTRFIDQHPVALVTGSDLDKTLEQLGETIVNTVAFSFNCSGNAVYSKGTCIHKVEWALPLDTQTFLQDHLVQSQYPYRFGNHFEQRIGMVNFSVVGRNAQSTERTDYFEWDKIHREREFLVDCINQQWPNLQAVVGGETGIDIFSRGNDKSQILHHINGDVQFFGDRMDIKGNDYSLAQAIIAQNRGKNFSVSSWTETQSILLNLFPSI